MFIIVATEILLSALCVRSRRAAKLVSGSPRVIIRNGVIDQATLFDLRFTVDDLLEKFRENAGKALDNDRILLSKVEAGN